MAVITFLDANIYIAAYDAESALAGKALEFFESSQRHIVGSDLLRLEVIPQAAFHQRTDEVSFHESCFALAKTWVEADADLVRSALRLAAKYGLHAMDSLHVATAITAGATEFITNERPTKPLYRVKELRVIYLPTFL